MRFNFAKTNVAQALALALGVAATGQAAAVTFEGGGASLPAPFMRTAADCWGNKENLLVRTGGSGTPLTVSTLADFNYTGDPAYDCATQQVSTTDSVRYMSTGSTRGVISYFTADPARLLDGATVPSGTTPYSAIQFAMSEAPLSTTQTSAWNNGGTVSGSFTVRAPGVADDPNVSTDYPNPSELYGPIIQVPALGTPVAIAFDRAYKRVKGASGPITTYRFQLQNGGQMRLDTAAYCEIFNGTISDWSDAKLTALNNGVPLLDPADPDIASGLPIKIVGRADGSGTTSLWTRHLAKVCGDLAAGSAIPANYYTDAKDNLGDLAAAGIPAARDLRRQGNEGVALELGTDTPAASQTVINGSIGYVGPDFLRRYAAAGSVGASLYLNPAQVQNANGNWVLPTPSTTATALAAKLPPQSNSDGSYNAAQPGDRSNPQDWVGALSKTDSLANPLAAGAYPIVGTSNFLLYSCYSTAGEVQALKRLATFGTEGFLRWWFKSANKTLNGAGGILLSSGFTPVPGAYRRAITDTYLGNSLGLNLDIRATGSGVCVGKPGA